jgi:hypothetical protein
MSVFTQVYMVGLWVNLCPLPWNEVNSKNHLKAWTVLLNWPFQRQQPNGVTTHTPAVLAGHCQVKSVVSFDTADFVPRARKVAGRRALPGGICAVCQRRFGVARLTRLGTHIQDSVLHLNNITARQRHTRPLCGGYGLKPQHSRFITLSRYRPNRKTTRDKKFTADPLPSFTPSRIWVAVAASPHSFSCVLVLSLLEDKI